MSYERQNWVNKFGRNLDSDTGDDIWDGSNAYPFQSTADTTTVVSDDAADADGGTGAHVVGVQGLDADWRLITQRVRMDGATPVNLPTNLIRCFRAWVEDVGSGEQNAGDITVAIGGTTVAQITAAMGQTLMAIYTVPDGQYGHLVQWRASGSGGAAQLGLQTRKPGQSWRTRDVLFIDANGASTPKGEFPNPQVFDPRTDIRVRALAGGNNLDIAAQFDLYINETRL